MKLTQYDPRATDAEIAAINEGRIKCATCKDMLWVIGLDNNIKPCPACRVVVNLND